MVWIFGNNWKCWSICSLRDSHIHLNLGNEEDDCSYFQLMLLQRFDGPFKQVFTQIV